MAINPSQLNTLNFWKSFDLPKFQKELDQVALDIANRQDDSDTSRQKLVEQSREFKKNSSEEIKKCVAPLFKNFQQEIDSLSKRSKAAEAAFLSVYKQIIEIADPSVLIEQFEKYQKVAQRVKDLEIENKQIREALVENNKELVQVKYYEELCKKLETKLKDTEKSIQSLTHATVSQMQEDMSKTFAERESRLLSEKDQMAETIDRLKNEISGLRTSYESINVQLFDLKNRYDEDIAAKNSEIDLLANDIEKISQRAEAAENESRNLKNAGINSTASSSNLAAGNFQALTMANQELQNLRSRLEIDIENKDSEILKLLNEVNRYKAQYDDLEKTINDKLSEFELHIKSKDDVIEVLKNKLAQMHDYETIKRELNLFKTIEFGESPIEDWKESTTDKLDTLKTEKDKTLEALVMEKNKTLKNENAILKNANSDLTNKYGNVNLENAEYRKRMTEQKSLIDKLEKDLNAMENMTLGSSDGGSGLQSSSDVLKLAASPMGGFPRYSSMESITSNTADSLLPIISSQRERFKIRNRELEGENMDLKNNLHGQTIELQQFKKDNLMLYEKIRFLQTYKGNTGGGNVNVVKESPDYRTGEARLNLRERSISPGHSRQHFEKIYEDKYETKLDPFRDFHLKEKMRKLQSLSVPEKVIHFVATRMVSNRMTRFFAFIYMIFMHFLVFMVLYQLAKIESCHRSESTNWEDKYSDHMRNYHKDKGP